MDLGARVVLLEQNAVLGQRAVEVADPLVVERQPEVIFRRRRRRRAADVYEPGAVPGRGDGPVGVDARGGSLLAAAGSDTGGGADGAFGDEGAGRSGGGSRGAISPSAGWGDGGNRGARSVGDDAGGGAAGRDGGVDDGAAVAGGGNDGVADGSAAD